ncbi:hypothetical protein ACSSS7_006017 [Eimeria intestinalis]
MDKDQVALLLLLEELPQQQQKQQQKQQEQQQQQERRAPRLLVAATTHLLFSPSRGDVKLAQLLCLFSALHAMRLRAVLRAYEYLTGSRGSLLMLKENEKGDTCFSNPRQTPSVSSPVNSGAAPAAPASSLPRETYAAAAAAAAAAGDAEGQAAPAAAAAAVATTTAAEDAGVQPATAAAAAAAAAAAGGGEEDDCVVGCERLHKTLRCPGAGEETLKETLVAWAASHSNDWRAEAEGLNEDTLKHAEALVHLVVCGDFNFTPQSPLYHLVVRGTMDFAALARAKLSGPHPLLLFFAAVTALLLARLPGACISFVWGCMRLFLCPWICSTPETSRILTQMPPGSACGWERTVISLASEQPPSAYKAAAAGGATSAAAAATAAALPDAAVQQQQQQGQSDSSPTIQAEGIQQQQQQQKQKKQQQQQQKQQQLQQQLLQIPSVVRLPFALKSAYAIPPTDPHWVWRVQKRMADEPRFACGRGGPSSTVKGLWGLASSPPPTSSDSSSSSSNNNNNNSNMITVGEYFEEPAYTAFHGWQKGCIDYIFFAPKNLKLWPASDHLSLVADLLPTGGPSGAPPANSKEVAGAAAAGAAAAPAPQAEKQDK